MPLTALDPTSALVVIDLQKGIVGLPTVHAMDGILHNARALADAFRGHGLPVVLVNVAGGGQRKQHLPAIGRMRPPLDQALLLQIGQGGAHRLRLHRLGAGEIRGRHAACLVQPGQRRELRPGQFARIGFGAQPAHQLPDRQR